MAALTEPKRLESIDITKIVDRFGNQWVALSPDLKTVYASGDTSTEVLAKAQTSGHLNAVIAWLPRSNLALSF